MVVAFLVVAIGSPITKVISSAEALARMLRALSEALARRRGMMVREEIVLTFDGRRTSNKVWE